MEDSKKILKMKVVFDMHMEYFKKEKIKAEIDKKIIDLAYFTGCMKTMEDVMKVLNE